jgi:hypothetical protein
MQRVWCSDTSLPMVYRISHEEKEVSEWETVLRMFDPMEAKATNHCTLNGDMGRSCKQWHMVLFLRLRTTVCVNAGQSLATYCGLCNCCIGSPGGTIVVFRTFRWYKEFRERGVAYRVNAVVRWS